MAPIGLKAVVGESKIISVLFYSKTGCCVALLRANAFFFFFFLACMCVLAGCGCQLVLLGGGGDDEEGGAVGVPLYLIVNLSRVAREL